MKQLFLLMAAAIQCHACCDFLLQSSDQSYVVGRSLEFAMPLDSSIVVRSRGEKWQSTTPKNQPGMQWTSKWGYISITPKDLNRAFDGMNEKGLSVASLWLPGAVYPNAPQDRPDRTIALQEVADWILGNFTSTEEVKEAIQAVYIWGNFVTPLKMVPPLHFSIHDLQGKSLVIEFTGGEVRIFDNPVKVMTNAPTFDWQLTNLRNYISLDAANVEPTSYNGYNILPTGQGSGLFGIPGDWTPPSRFVRLFTYKRFAAPPQTAADAIMLALHILNTVDIPFGTIREHAASPAGDYTQWIVVKDLTNKSLYFRSYENQNIYKIDLGKLDLSQAQNYTPVPIKRPPAAIDLTPKMQSRS